MRISFCSAACQQNERKRIQFYIGFRDISFIKSHNKNSQGWTRVSNWLYGGEGMLYVSSDIGSFKHDKEKGDEFLEGKIWGSSAGIQIPC
jgi:hypothetical protein